MTWWWGW